MLHTDIKELAPKYGINDSGHSLSPRMSTPDHDLILPAIPHEGVPPPGPAFKRKGSAFWMSFSAITVSMFLSALDISSIPVILPTMAQDLNGGDHFVWVGSAYSLASTAILPLSGGLADIYGRKPIMIISIILFALGSALAGAARNMNMMIGARSTFFPSTFVSGAA